MTNQSRLSSGSSLLLYSAFALILLLLFGARLGLINKYFPYVVHYDENHLTGPAWHMLQTGDFKPGFYAYPSLPIYLTFAGLNAGLLMEAPKYHDPARVKDFTYPYYESPEVIYPVRALWALLSIIALGTLTWITARQFENRWLLLLIPIVVACSHQFLFMSHKYINVDMPGTMFAVLVLAAVFYLRKREGLYSSFFVGLLAGLTIACKYSLGLVLILPVLGVLFYRRDLKLLHIIHVFLGAALGFLVAMPYALLDYTSFIRGVAAEVTHYRLGHAGAVIRGFIPHLLENLRLLIADYGLASAPFALLGLWHLFRKQWKAAVLLTSFPVLHLLFISRQRVNFERNILVVYLFYGLLVAVGLYAATRMLADRVRTSPLGSRIGGYRTLAAGAVVALLFAVFLPWASILDMYNTTPESRHQAIDWIIEHVEPGSTVVTAISLGMDVRELEEDYTIVSVPFKWLSAQERDAAIRDHVGALITIPQYSMDPRFPKRNYGAKELNDWFKSRTRRLQRFGSRGVLENYDRPASNGDPDFFLGRVLPLERY